MKTLCFFKITLSIFFSVFVFSFSSAQLLSINTKDTVNGHPKNSLSIGGYVKLVVAYDYLGLPNGSSFTLAEIPTTGDVKNSSLNANAWQSRIKLRNNYYTQKGEKIHSYIEGDFHGGNNGGGFRLRHAYVNFKNWTMGHTNSVFTNDDVWLNISDFDGPPVGTWVRQPQIRYTHILNKNNQFNFSVESPVVDYRAIDTSRFAFASNQSNLPDVLANYRRQFKGGSFQLSGVVRSLSYKENNIKEEAVGYGATFSGTFNFLKKDILMYQALAGRGIERYLVGLGGYGLDGVYYNSEFSTIPVYGGYVGYQHYWNSNVNSSFMYGYQELRNELDDNYPSRAFSGNYYSANVFFNPIEKINLGFEFVYGDKRDYLDNQGRNHRFYFTMEYSF